VPALTITQLYRQRWQIELFFQWIKQHLRIKSFFGTSENAVKTQIWIATSAYVLVAILKKRLHLSDHVRANAAGSIAYQSYFSANRLADSNQLNLFD
jgi:IS4 transposase